jgi:hypothetical protein
MKAEVTARRGRCHFTRFSGGKETGIWLNSEVFGMNERIPSAKSPHEANNVDASGAQI